MKRYQRTFRRHKLLVIAPILLALVVALGYQFSAPKHYQAWGTLWADAPVPNDSTVFAQQQPNPSAASQQSAVLQEMLSTNQYLAEVGKRSPYAQYLRQHPDQLDSVFGSLQKNTSISVLGPQVIRVAYTSSDQADAVPMAKAIMNAFVAQLVSLEQARAKQQIAYNQQSVNSAAKALTGAQSSLSAYLATHPGAAASTVDPTANQLSGEVATAQQTYGTAVAQYNQAVLDLSHASSTGQIHVLDQPNGAIKQSSKKKFVYTAIGGLFAGAVISLLLLSRLVSKDTSPWDAEDIEDELGLNVVASINQVPSGARRTWRAS
jgi:uncharacterized protein involved in exopolysaccharide biosynthesis